MEGVLTKASLGLGAKRLGMDGGSVLCGDVATVIVEAVA
jgi:hypothetical protein